MVVGERTRDVLVMVVLHSGHSAVCMGEKRIGGRGGGLVAVGRAICWTPRPCGLVVHLRRVLVGGELVGNARGLLRVVHGIGGERRHAGGLQREGWTRKNRRENDYENRERKGKGGWEMVVGVVKNSERGVFVVPCDDEHRSCASSSAD